MRNDSAKETIEWKALNSIWSSCSTEQRMALRSEFETVAKFIRRKTRVIKPYKPKDDFSYLDALSDEAKQFVISIVNNGEKNIYHSLMAIINNVPGSTKEEVLDYYFAKYSKKRPYLVENRSLVCEIFDLCWNRMHDRYGA